MHSIWWPLIASIRYIVEYRIQKGIHLTSICWQLVQWHGQFCGLWWYDMVCVLQDRWVKVNTSSKFILNLENNSWTFWEMCFFALLSSLKSCINFDLSPFRHVFWTVQLVLESDRISGEEWGLIIAWSAAPHWTWDVGMIFWFLTWLSRGCCEALALLKQSKDLIPQGHCFFAHSINHTM